MSADRTERVRELFLAARGLDRDERTGFLERATAGDATLLQDVRDLLEADEADARFLESPALGHSFREQAVESIVTTHEEQQLDRIGPYRVEKLVGEGGFARVYSAQQESPVRRRVAIKLLKPGVATQQVVRRFEAERQHLASMDHPAIAHIFDAGTMEDGRPYYIMEYVDGITIIEYCGQKQPSLQERLVLFLKVCEAVHYAHQRGVIHRDLKPTNILIDTSGESATPKVIDFGVAKAIGESARDDTVHTQAGQLIGTPEYMSPEQAGSAPLDLDTRADVYSLGVVLYEMLTGSRPLTFSQRQRADWLEMIRAIREQQPLKPSTRISSAKSALSHNAAATVTLACPPPAGDTESGSRSQAERSPSVPPTPARELRGDLDWIVMKCLEKQRTDRYESVAALAADIRHYLNCEPVSVGPPTTLYWLVKLVRKHRMRVISGALLLGLLAVAVVTTVHSDIQKARTQAAVAQAQIAAEKERSASASAQTYAAILETFLSAPMKRGYATTVLDVMRDAERMIEKGQFPKEAEAHVRLRLGKNWRAFGDCDRAESHLLSARRLYEEAGDTVNAARAGILIARLHQDLESLFETGSSNNPTILVEQGLQQVPVANDDTWEVRVELLLLRADTLARTDIEAARHAAIEAKQVLDRYAAKETYLHGSWLAMDACLRVTAGESSEVLSDLREAHAILRRTLGAAHRETLDNLVVFGQVAEMLGEHERAEHLFGEATQDVQRSLGPEHPRVATILVSRAETYFRSRSREAAKSDLRTALSLCNEHIESEDPAWLQVAQYCVKVAAKHRVHLNDVEQLAMRVVTIMEERFGLDHRQLIIPLNHLNAARWVSGKFTPETAATMRREIGLRERYMGKRGIGYLARVCNLAECLGKQGHYDEALAILEEPLEIVREDYGGHPRYPTLLPSYEQMYLSGLMVTERYAEGETFLLGIYEREMELQHNPEYLILQCDLLSDLYGKWGKPELASEWANKAEARRMLPEQAEQQTEQP